MNFLSYSVTSLNLKLERIKRNLDSKTKSSLMSFLHLAHLLKGLNYPHIMWSINFWAIIIWFQLCITDWRTRMLRTFSTKSLQCIFTGVYTFVIVNNCTCTTLTYLYFLCRTRINQCITGSMSTAFIFGAVL